MGTEYGEFSRKGFPNIHLLAIGQPIELGPDSLARSPFLIKALSFRFLVLLLTLSHPATPSRLCCSLRFLPNVGEASRGPWRDLRVTTS